MVTGRKTMNGYNISSPDNVACSDGLDLGNGEVGLNRSSPSGQHSIIG